MDNYKGKPKTFFQIFLKPNKKKKKKENKLKLFNTQKDFISWLLLEFAKLLSFSIKTLKIISLSRLLQRFIKSFSKFSLGFKEIPEGWIKSSISLFSLLKLKKLINNQI